MVATFRRHLEFAPLPAPAEKIDQSSIVQQIKAELKLELMNDITLRFNSLLNRIDNIDFKVDNLSYKYDQLLEKSSKFNLHRSTEEFDFVSTRSENPNTASKIDHLHTDIPSHHALLERLDARVDKLDAKVDRCDINSSTCTTKLEEQENLFKAYQESIKTIEARVEKAQENGIIVSEKLKMLEVDTENIKEDMARASDNIEEVEGGLSVECKTHNIVVKQHQIRAMNSVLIAAGRWALPVPTSDDRYAPAGLKDFPQPGEWALHSPHRIQELNQEDLDDWLEAYGLGEKCHNFGSMEVTSQQKRAFLFHFIGGNYNLSFFQAED
ncbi:uncharacterized protein L201_001740 [Kwoniella dendrophila CBS 6074]|uniref:Uncharacterized protein n=1 Tax=Kwoniella dendrophila CBS 6074 TaxID=1295534 RepID=A0AAX4JN69_9TREE